MAQNNIQSYEIVGGVLKEMLTLILGENAPSELIDEYMQKMQAREAQAVTMQEQQMVIQQEQMAQAEQEPQLSPEQIQTQALANGEI